LMTCDASCDAICIWQARQSHPPLVFIVISVSGLLRWQRVHRSMSVKAGRSLRGWVARCRIWP
jgi:hypothetical protein